MSPIRKILVPVDFGELSEPALEKAVVFAAALGASVTALHVDEYSLWAIDGGAELTIDSARRIREAAAIELERLVDRHRSRNDVEIEGVIREGAPSSEILHYAKESAADLIVMGTHGRHGLPHALLGSVAEKVVRLATVPVLTLRGPSHSNASAEGEKETGAPEKGAPEGLETAHHAEEVLAISGAVAGATVGIVAGPPGVAIGTVIGAAMGMAAGKTLDNEDKRKHLREEQLDRAIGVSGGDLGAAPPNQPPARVGAYSAASAGVGASPSSSSEGPIQSLDED
jgi:nucleotide-binding universal stress UspA family protein